MVEQSSSEQAQAGAASCVVPSSLDSIVDRLMGLAGPDAHGDEIDRAVTRHAQITLARSIRTALEAGEVAKAA